MKVFSRTIGISSRRGLLSEKEVARAVRQALQGERKRIRGEFNVIFVDNQTIRRLNRRFLGERGVTDVIAFPYESETAGLPAGDVFISVPVARKNAAAYGEPPSRELLRLVVHGVLHILGYDDHRPSDRKRMWKRQESVVERLWAKRSS